MWRYIKKIRAIPGRLHDLEDAVRLLASRAGRGEKRMNALAELIEEQTKRINQYAADITAYQGNVNPRFAKMEATIARLTANALSDEDAALLNADAQALKAAVSALPIPTLPESEATQTMLTDPAPPAPVQPVAAVPVFPGVPAAPDDGTVTVETNAPDVTDTVPDATADASGTKKKG